MALFSDMAAVVSAEITAMMISKVGIRRALSRCLFRYCSVFCAGKAEFMMYIELKWAVKYRRTEEKNENSFDWLWILGAKYRKKS